MAQRVALITGAGSGIGRAVAHALAARGYALILAGRRAAALEETAASLADTLCVATDVTRPEAVERLFAAGMARFGRIDLLFNNAGTNAPPALLEDLTVDAWQQVISVNLTGAFLCMQAAFRVMKAQHPHGGRIINNGSISAHAPRPNSSAYTASKHAITGLTKCASLDGRKYDIACGQIDIGNAATDMASAMTKGAPQADGSIAVEHVFDVTLVGDAVAYMDSLPLAANVQFMTVMATKMPFIGRG
jgi:NAD(P)-dependent dehydrogenase (short-subunit alcohol dehydrogenase family)